MAAKHALVTGGNRGLGLAVCKQLVSEGKPVLLTARGAAAGEKAVDELRASAAAGTDIKALPLDAKDAGSIKELAAAVANDYDRAVDLLVVNAGVFKKEWTPKGLAECVAVNFAGAVDTALALGPHLAPGALVVFVSSGLGALAKLSPDYAEPISAAATLDALRLAAARYDPQSAMRTANGAYSPDYSVSKAALNRAVQLLAADGGTALGGGGGGGTAPAVCAVCPGWCRTDMGTAAAERSAEQGADSILAPYRKHAKGASVNGTFSRDGEEIEW